MQAAGRFLNKIANQAISRYGFAYADLLANWPQVVGEELAEICQPQRINWPQKKGGANNKSTGQRLAGTLVLRCEPGRALELQYEVPKIIEQINRYYGYQAVMAVKFVQGPLSRKKDAKPRPLEPLKGEKLEQTRKELSAVSDDKLKAALMRLASGALADRD